MTALSFLWLAGLLEGEGTFLKPPPSAPRTPCVSCRMTDRDVIDRVASYFGVTVGQYDRGCNRTEYMTSLKGASAVALMEDLLPLMGERRREAIRRALDARTESPRKLSYARAERIRLRYAEGETVSSLGRRYGVARPTVRQVLRGGIYGGPLERPWLRQEIASIRTPRGFVRSDLYWLAGWLEGEGSFMSPPPSDPRRARISAHSSDADVVQRAAAILGVSAVKHGDSRSSERGWATPYQVLKRGSGAIAVMVAIEPLLGERRRRQVRRALATVGRSLPASLPSKSHTGAY